MFGHTQPFKPRHFGHFGQGGLVLKFGDGDFVLRFGHMPQFKGESPRAWFREGVGDWDWYEFIYEQIAAAYCRTIAGLA